MKKANKVKGTPAAGSGVLEEIGQIEQDYREAIEGKRAELQATRLELIAKLREVDRHLGTDSLGTAAKARSEGRLKRGELERFIREALAQGPAPIGQLLDRVRQAGLSGKDASIRSKMGNRKWIAANGIVKNGSSFALKK